jgi:hypothetical protein
MRDSLGKGGLYYIRQNNDPTNILHTWRWGAAILGAFTRDELLYVKIS